MPLIIEPDNSVVTLAQARAFLPVTGEDDDALIQMLIDAAVDAVEGLIGPVQVRTVTEPYFGGPYPRTATNVVITDEAGNVINGGGSQGSPYLRWDEPAGIMGHGWYQSLTITYTAGRNPVPPAIRLAILYTVQHAYESQRGAVPVSFQGGADETFTLSRGFFVPNRAKELLAPFIYEGRVA